MDDREFQKQKNLKDLDFNKELNFLVTFAVLFGTFAITIFFTEALIPITSNQTKTLTDFTFQLPSQE